MPKPNEYVKMLLTNKYDIKAPQLYCITMVKHKWKSSSSCQFCAEDLWQNWPLNCC